MLMGEQVTVSLMSHQSSQGFGASSPQVMLRSDANSCRSYVCGRVRRLKMALMKLTRSWLRTWLPPALDPLVRTLFGSVRFSGEYPTFTDASSRCKGYGADAILERVKRSALAVKRGEAAYEQDSVLFYEPDYLWPMLSNLLWIALQRGHKLHVLDFGGSLGSCYYRHRRYLNQLRDFRWSIVEQPQYVACGQELFEDEVLRFFPDIGSCVAACPPDVVLVSGVLQYLESPHEFLEQLQAYRVPFLLFDATPFDLSDRDRIRLQHVAEPIYQATYPAWFFSRTRFLAALDARYRVVAEWRGADRGNVPSEFRGVLFESILDGT